MSSGRSRAAGTPPWQTGVRALRQARAVDVLLASASAQACALCSFDRAIILAVEEGALSARTVGPIGHQPSEELRRLALTRPLTLQPGTPEAEALRRVAVTPIDASRPGVLAEALHLQRAVVAPIVPEDQPLALLVLDRAEDDVGDRDVAAVERFCLHLEGAVESVVLRARLAEMRSELQHLTVSANAMAREASTSPVMLNADHGQGPTFATSGVHFVPRQPISDLLSSRERDIAALLVTGKSNREIAAELHLSPETVKSYVAKLLRKLGAANRVEAVTRYMALAHGRE